MKSLTLFYILLAWEGIRSESLNLTEEHPEPWLENRTSNGSGCVHVSSLSGEEECEKQTTDVGDKQIWITFKLFKKIFRQYVDPVIAIIGLISAVMSILVVRKSSLKTSTSVYIVGLTSSNIIYIFVAMVFQFSEYESISSLTSYQNIYSYKVMLLFVLTFIPVSSHSWVVLVFTVERLIAILWPLKAHIISREGRAKKIVVAIYVLAVMINIGQMLRFKVDVRNDPVTNETRHFYTYTEIGRNVQAIRAMYLVFAIPSVLIPFPLLAILIFVMIVKLRVAVKARTSLEEGPASQSKTSKQAQVERILVGNICAYLFCNFFAASNTLTVAIHGTAIIYQSVLEFDIRNVLVKTLYLCNPTLNFLVYVYSSESLRDSLKKLMGIQKGKTPKDNKF